MTAMKRRRHFFFAIVCALVLVGGSLKASAGGIAALWTPAIELVHGIKFSNGERQVHIKFRIVALMAEDLPMEVCARFHHTVYSGGFEANKCDPDQFSSEGSGKYKVVFNVPSQSPWGPISKTGTSIKANIQLKNGTTWNGAWTEYKYTNW